MKPNWRRSLRSPVVLAAILSGVLLICSYLWPFEITFPHKDGDILNIYFDSGYLTFDFMLDATPGTIWLPQNLFLEHITVHSGYIRSWNEYDNIGDCLAVWPLFSYLDLGGASVLNISLWLILLTVVGSGFFLSKLR